MENNTEAKDPYLGKEVLHFSANYGNVVSKVLSRIETQKGDIFYEIEYSNDYNIIVNEDYVRDNLITKTVKAD